MEHNVQSRFYCVPVDESAAWVNSYGDEG